jgi:hypothetical protein
MYLSVLRAIFLKSQGPTIELLGVIEKGRDGWGDGAEIYRGRLFFRVESSLIQSNFRSLRDLKS